MLAQQVPHYRYSIQVFIALQPYAHTQSGCLGQVHVLACEHVDMDAELLESPLGCKHAGESSFNFDRERDARCSVPDHHQQKGVWNDN